MTSAQSILNSLSIYYFSLLKVSEMVTNPMEKLIRDFMWSGGLYNPGSNPVKWESTDLPPLTVV